MNTIKAGDRVHCDKWLAYRDDGWAVTYIYADGTLRIDFTNQTAAYVLQADCTLIPPPLQVGDRVRTAVGLTALVYAVNDGQVWLGYGDGSAAPALQPHRLERIQ